MKLLGYAHWFIELFIGYKSGLDFSVHKLAKFSANLGKLHFEGMVHILGYIRDNNILGLKYYADMNYAPVSEILIQAWESLEGFLSSSWKDYSDTVIITGAYIIFYQGGPIDHGTHVPGPVAQSSA